MLLCLFKLDHSSGDALRRSQIPTSVKKNEYNVMETPLFALYNAMPPPILA